MEKDNNPSSVPPPPPPLPRRKLKWTEFIPLEKHDDASTFIVCLNRDGLSAAELNHLVSACNTRIGRDIVSRRLTYAGDCFEMPWKEREHAYTVMDVLLKAGMPLFTQTRMCVTADPADLATNETCTPEWLERTVARKKHIEIMFAANQFFNGDLSRAIDSACATNPHVFSHESAWLTKEGRALVQWIVSYHRLNADSSDEETTSAPPESGKRPVTDILDLDQQQQPPQKKQRLDDVVVVEDDKEGDEAVVEPCVICLVNPPNTLVLECMHCVVCSTCSERLKTTADQHTCVHCRRPIVAVLQDEK